MSRTYVIRAVHAFKRSTVVESSISRASRASSRMASSRYVGPLLLLLLSGGLEVCVVLEPGFDMVLAGVDPATITSDAQLSGFNVDVRRAVLGSALDLVYNVRVLDSWDAMQAYTRISECDIAWGANYVLGNRERCTVNTTTCRPAAEISTASDLSAYSCCLDFSVQYCPWSISIMAVSAKRRRFFNALVTAIFEPF
eukprot:1227673-Prymnesium_polylepis.1